MTREDFLPLARPDIGQAELAIVKEVVESGWWTTGPKVFEFEKKLAQYLNGNNELHVAALNSCTSALFLALKALGIGKGDEVIVPTWTFAATLQVVEWLDATPVLCDIEGDSLNIDIAKAEKLITAQTKAVIPVHMAGYPCDMSGLAAMAKRNNIKIIEDAAHAIGTKFNGTKIGNFSDVTCFSFYATKNLAMGEGGAAVSKDKEVIEKITKLAYFGINKEAFKRYEKAGTWLYDIEELGYKCNLDSMHAALGIAQLQKLDAMNNRRREIASRYKSELASEINFTTDSEKHFHTYHIFPIILPESVNRNDFIEHLKAKNIGASVHFIPLHKHSFYKDRFPDDKYSVANKLFKSIVSIPMFPGMTDDDVNYVIHHINNYLGHKS